METLFLSDGMWKVEPNPLKAVENLHDQFSRHECSRERQYQAGLIREFPSGDIPESLSVHTECAQIGYAFRPTCQLWRNRLKGSDRDRWMQLCALAAIEQDPAKLLALVREINRLLEEKESRLKGKKPSSVA